MQELDIHGAPIPGAHQQQQLGARPPGLRGGWEGGDGGAAAAAAAGAGGVEGGAEGGVPGSGMPPVDEAVDKLDSMMELVLEHIGRRCAAGGCVGWAGGGKACCGGGGRGGDVEQGPGHGAPIG